TPNAEEARSLQAEEHAVPQPASGLPPRYRGYHRAEYGCVANRDDRGADLEAYPLDSVSVRRPHRLVVLGGVHRVRQVRRQPSLGQRGLDGGPVLLGLLVVEPGADRRGEREHRVRAELLLGGRNYPDRPPRLRQPLLITFRQVVPAFVEYREAHHVPARCHLAHQRHLEHPARGYPGPWAERVEPEIYLHRLLISHNISSTAQRREIRP